MEASGWNIENVVVQHLPATAGRVESPQRAMIPVSCLIVEEC